MSFVRNGLPAFVFEVQAYRPPPDFSWEGPSQDRFVNLFFENPYRRDYQVLLERWLVEENPELVSPHEVMELNIPGIRVQEDGSEITGVRKFCARLPVVFDYKFCIQLRGPIL